MSKIIKGDHVVVISGRDKGKQGQVTRLLGDKVVVEGVNLVKRHQKPNPMRNVEGGMVVKSMPIHISNVAIYNKETQKADRVRRATCRQALLCCSPNTAATPASPARLIWIAH